MRQSASPWVCLSLGGAWAEGHGRSVVLYQGATRTPTPAVVRLSLRQGPSAIHGIPVRLVGDGPDSGLHGSAVLSVTALQWVDLSHAIAYGSVRYYEPAGSGGEGDVTFYAYRLSRDASGWRVTTAKSVTGFGQHLSQFMRSTKLRQ